jgi:hypothetical protein
MVLFRVLPGLPPYGPAARAFPASFGRTGREGYVVEFCSDTSAAWVGNFRRGWGGYEGVCLHPNGNDVVVFASGNGYIVDPHTGGLRDEIRGHVEYLWQVSDPPGFIYDLQGLAFVRIGPDGLYWHSRRLSWDGFRDVVFTVDRITGLAYLPSGTDDRWCPFEVELATGRSLGGSYGIDDAAQWEKLAGQ